MNPGKKKKKVCSFCLFTQHFGFMNVMKCRLVFKKTKKASQETVVLFSVFAHLAVVVGRTPHGFLCGFSALWTV